jgi:hypothetical protein
MCIVGALSPMNGGNMTNRTGVYVMFVCNQRIVNENHA